MFEIVTGEMPTHGAVSQGDHAIFDARVDQRLGADNAARTPGTIDDHQGVRGRRDIVDPVGKFRPGHADAGGNVAGVILDHGAAIENDHVLALVHHLFQFIGGHRRCLVLDLDILSECLAGNVDTAEYFQARFPPGVDTAVEHTDVLITEVQQALRGTLGKSLATVADDDPGRAARNHGGGENLQAAER